MCPVETEQAARLARSAVNLGSGGTACAASPRGRGGSATLPIGERSIAVSAESDDVRRTRAGTRAVLN